MNLGVDIRWGLSCRSTGREWDPAHKCHYRAPARRFRDRSAIRQCVRMDEHAGCGLASGESCSASDEISDHVRATDDKYARKHDVGEQVETTALAPYVGIETLCP